MSKISERLGYIHGMMDGLKLDKDDDRIKLCGMIVDVLNDMSQAIDKLESSVRIFWQPYARVFFPCRFLLRLIWRKKKPPCSLRPPSICFYCFIFSFSTFCLWGPNCCGWVR